MFAQKATRRMLYLFKWIYNRNIFEAKQHWQKKKCHCKPLSAAKNTALPSFGVVCNDIFLFSLFPFECTPNRHGFNGNFYFSEEALLSANNLPVD